MEVEVADVRLQNKPVFNLNAPNFVPARQRMAQAHKEPSGAATSAIPMSQGMQGASS